ncbi:MAG: phosphate signaling complex PhoU family protein [Phycisphaerales bacterium JB065]
MPELRQGPLGDRLSTLKTDLVEQGRHVQRIVEAAVQSIFDKDPSLAEKVVNEDEVVDRVDIKIERAAVSLLTDSMELCSAGGADSVPPLSAYQIRMILTIVKVNNEFERIADLAVAMVTRMGTWLKLPGDPPRRFRVMANSVIGMIEHTVMSLEEMDTDAARLVLASDDATDAFRAAILRENEEELAAGNRSAEYAFTLNRVAAAIARMADHCTNIAEQVIYVETGKIVRHTEEQWTEPSEPDIEPE